MSQMELSWDRAEQGIRQSADHADSVDPGWGESCYQAPCDYLRETREFNSHEFRQFLGSIGFPVEVPKALGAVLLRAARAGLIRKIGYDPHPERHSSPTPRWARS